MTLSLEQLVGLVTKDQAMQTLIDLLTAQDYAARSWESGSLQRTLLEIFSEMYAEVRVVGALLARAGHNQFSSGDWLTLYSDSQYDNQRLSGRKTQGIVTVVDHGTGPHTIDLSTLLVSDEVFDFRYRNVSSGILPQNGSLQLKVEAETVGAAQNLGNNTIAVQVQGPPGATVSNPALGGGSWITQNGADDEKDPALRTRNRTKWATLALAGGPEAVYDYWARKADTSVRRVQVDTRNASATGALTVYVAGDDGALPAAVVAAVGDYIRGSDGVGRRPIGANLTVLSATEREVAFTAAVYLQPALANDEVTQDAVAAAVETFFESVPIGGTLVDASGSGKLLLGKLYHAIFSVTGVANVSLSLLADVTLAADEVAVPMATYQYSAAY
jgi:phage-related baseplate assembly protein